MPLGEPLVGGVWQVAADRAASLLLDYASDYDGKALLVRRSVWRKGIINQPKTDNQQPMNLDNWANRVIVPTIKKRLKCRKPEHEHKTDGQMFELDPAPSKS